MVYTLENGKVIKIPDKEIKNNMEKLSLTEKEAIQLYLEDNDFEINEELEELDAKATGKIRDRGITVEKKKTNKPRAKKISDQKKLIFTTILTALQSAEDFSEANIEILKDNKLIQVKIDDKIIKIDFIEQRPPKK